MFPNRRGYRNGNHFRHHPRGRDGGGAGRGRRHPVPLAWKEHLWTAALAAASLCAWFATPVSHWFTTALLWQIPVEVDVRLGRNALMDQLENECPTVYDPQYTPLIRSIGHELVQIQRNGLPQRRLWWNLVAAIRTLRGRQRDPFRWTLPWSGPRPSTPLRCLEGSFECRRDCCAS
jgi:hypothetical protein